MNYETLINGYKHVLNTLYSPKQYYERVKILLKEYKPQGVRKGKLYFYHIRAFFMSIWVLGIKEKGRKYYWKLVVSTLLKRPRFFPLSISLAIYGYHFRKVVEEYINTPIKGTPGFHVAEKAGG